MQLRTRGLPAAMPAEPDHSVQMRMNILKLYRSTDSKQPRSTVFMHMSKSCTCRGRGNHTYREQTESRYILVRALVHRGHRKHQI